MADKLLGFLDKRPLIWFHYVLLLFVLWVANYAGNFCFNLNLQNIWIKLIWYYVWISLGDQIIHLIIKED